MPSGLDILGILSFVQGVVTVIAAGILAFIAATEQFRDNKSAIYDVTQQINRIDAMFPPAFVVTTEHDADLLLELREIREGLRDIVELPARWRWWNSGDIAKTITTVSARAARLASETAEMRLMYKILDVVNQAHQRDFQLLRHQISKLERLKLKTSSFLDPRDFLDHRDKPLSIHTRH
ncbi:hypothetical protein DFH09DRAFT_1369407 [Mycena vulgaris]|nr:hypothetical protein DFH09DRAFT_1369407 [Mycena vulgaris]